MVPTNLELNSGQVHWGSEYHFYCHSQHVNVHKVIMEV